MLNSGIVDEQNGLDFDDSCLRGPLDDDQAADYDDVIAVDGIAHSDDADFGIRKTSWRAEAGQEAHDRAKIVPADVDHVALLKIVVAAKPGLTVNDGEILGRCGGV